MRISDWSSDVCSSDLLHLMHVRKTLVFVDEGRSEAMQTADIPLRKVAAVAVVKNPLVGCYQDDLSELVAASPSIGELVAGLALAALAPFQPEDRKSTRLNSSH